jgi:hypothetical protein
MAGSDKPPPHYEAAKTLTESLLRGAAVPDSLQPYLPIVTGFFRKYAYAFGALGLAVASGAYWQYTHVRDERAVEQAVREILKFITDSPDYDRLIDGDNWKKLLDFIGEEVMARIESRELGNAKLGDRVTLDVKGYLWKERNYRTGVEKRPNTDGHQGPRKRIKVQQDQAHSSRSVHPSNAEMQIAIAQSLEAADSHQSVPDEKMQETTTPVPARTKKPRPATPAVHRPVTRSQAKSQSPSTTSSSSEPQPPTTKTTTTETTTTKLTTKTAVKPPPQPERQSLSSMFRRKTISETNSHLGSQEATTITTTSLAMETSVKVPTASEAQSVPVNGLQHQTPPHPSSSSPHLGTTITTPNLSLKTSENRLSVSEPQGTPAKTPVTRFLSSLSSRRKRRRSREGRPTHSALRSALRHEGSSRNRKSGTRRVGFEVGIRADRTPHIYHPEPTAPLESPIAHDDGLRFLSQLGKLRPLKRIRRLSGLMEMFSPTKNDPPKLTDINAPEPGRRPYKYRPLIIEEPRRSRKRRMRDARNTVRDLNYREMLKEQMAQLPQHTAPEPKDEPAPEEQDHVQFPPSSPLPGDMPGTWPEKHNDDAEMVDMADIAVPTSRNYVAPSVEDGDSDSEAGSPTQQAHTYIPGLGQDRSSLSPPGSRTPSSRSYVPPYVEMDSDSVSPPQRSPASNDQFEDLGFRESKQGFGYDYIF